ncbi:MAG: ABC transporter ATP-binding protein [Clostridiaceae bacterium]|nr:ABC transporter ATP-binding protein [Clostridiaceae bacterium]
MEYTFRTENVYRRFKSGSEIVEALKNVNINIPKNKLSIFRGPSGSGKTTLINILGSLDRPSEGKVFFDDEEISKLSDKKRDDIRRVKCGFIFQSVALISNMSAFENVDFGLRIAGVSKGRRKRAEECLKLVGLGKRMTHRPQQLSGGEQQRVAIARAIAHRPQVLFADEPTAELDTQTGLQVVRLFKSLVEQEGITVVMTTHDPNMMEVADYVFNLEDGVVLNGQ